MDKIKQVIIWRNDLKVHKGKFASQIAHASMKVFFDRMKQICDVTHHIGNIHVFNGKFKWSCDFTPEMIEWMQGSFTKIVVGCKDEAELLELKKQVDEAGIVNALITDNGDTEFKQECFACSGKGYISILLSSRMYKGVKGADNCINCNGTGKINKPTITCLAIGPDYSSRIDPITKELKLL